MTDRSRFRARARTGGGASYDADAQAYITRAGELFPEALNTLVLGIKAAGLWDDHIGSIKKAIGVPSLAASLIDLRNTAFNGTAVNTPGHSATAGWTFTAASSQYIDSEYQPGVANSKSSLDSSHVGVRFRSGGGSGMALTSLFQNSAGFWGYHLVQDGLQRCAFNDGVNLATTWNPAASANYIGTRTTAASLASYINGSSAATSTTASVGIPPGNVFIGARNVVGTGPANFLTGRISLWHAGAGLDAAQAAALNTLFNAYATAAGET